MLCHSRSSWRRLIDWICLKLFTWAISLTGSNGFRRWAATTSASRTRPTTGTTATSAAWWSPPAAAPSSTPRRSAWRCYWSPRRRGCCPPPPPPPRAAPSTSPAQAPAARPRHRSAGVWITQCGRIHDILVWIRIRGSMPLTNGSGSFCFLHWPSRCQQKSNLKKSFFAYYFLKVLLHNFTKI